MSIEDTLPNAQPNDDTHVFCPKCNALLSRASLNKHLRTQHGESPKRRGRPPGSKNGVRTLPTPRTPKPITAEQIVRTAAAMLWPEGTPHDMLEPLLHWHAQTEAFLAKAQGR